MYINTCEQGYQSTSFIGKYKEYLCSPNNICFEIKHFITIPGRGGKELIQYFQFILQKIKAEIPLMNKHNPIRIGYIGFCLIGGSRYISMVAQASMASNEQTTNIQPIPIVQHTEKCMSNYCHTLKTLE